MRLTGIVAAVIVLGAFGYNAITAFDGQNWATFAVQILGLLGGGLMVLAFFGDRVPVEVDSATGIQITAFLMALILLTHYLLRRFAPRVLRSPD